MSAYGVNARLSVPDAEMLEGVVGGLPRSWIRTTDVLPPDRIAATFTVVREQGRYLIRDGDRGQTHYADRDVATGMLRRMVRRVAVARIQDRTCVDASVVTYKGRAIMLPTRAFAGTTTLVRALVAAGAERYSDELTLIDADGGLVSDLEFHAGAPAVVAPLALVALTVYQPGAVWAPKPMSPAEGVVALMAYVASRDRPAEALAALRLALSKALVLESDRDEAEDTAAALLEAVQMNSGGEKPSE